MAGIDIISGQYYFGAPVKNDKVHLSRERKYIKKTMILILILVTFIARDYIGLKYMISIINALLEGTVLAMMSVFQNQLKGLISGAKLHKL